jgi:hypothetical protein
MDRREGLLGVEVNGRYKVQLQSPSENFLLASLSYLVLGEALVGVVGRVLAGRDLQALPRLLLLSHERDRPSTPIPSGLFTSEAIISRSLTYERPRKLPAQGHPPGSTFLTLPNLPLARPPKRWKNCVSARYLGHGVGLVV